MKFKKSFLYILIIFMVQLNRINCQELQEYLLNIQIYYLFFANEIFVDQKDLIKKHLEFDLKEDDLLIRIAFVKDVLNPNITVSPFRHTSIEDFPEYLPVRMLMKDECVPKTCEITYKYFSRFEEKNILLRLTINFEFDSVILEYKYPTEEMRNLKMQKLYQLQPKKYRQLLKAKEQEIQEITKFSSPLNAIIREYLP